MDAFEPFFRAVASLLAVLYSFTHSYGIAIIILTIIVMAVTTPLTLKSTRSMMEMQRHQPELRRIQAKYKDDRERLNAEMMAFYRENNINPVSSCLPMLLQAPVFLILYRVIHGITNRVSGGGGAGAGHAVGQALADKSFTPWRLTDQPFVPDHLSKTTELYRSLSVSTKMTFLGMDLSLTPLQAVKIGIWTAIPFIVLSGAMLVSQIYQNRQIQGRNTGDPVNSQQQMMMKVLPFMLPAFSFFYPAGLGVYYFVQGLCRIGMQGYITKKFYGEDSPLMAARAQQAAESAASAGTKKQSSKAPSATKSAGGAKSGGKSGGKASLKSGKKSGGKVTGRQSGAPRATQRPRGSGSK